MKTGPVTKDEIAEHWLSEAARVIDSPAIEDPDYASTSALIGIGQALLALGDRFDMLNTLLVNSSKL